MFRGAEKDAKEEAEEQTRCKRHVYTITSQASQVVHSLGLHHQFNYLFLLIKQERQKNREKWTEKDHYVVQINSMVIGKKAYYNWYS